MPQLLKKVEGEILPYVIGDVRFVTSISGQIQLEDFINLNGFIAFLQNLSRTEFTAALSKPMEFGLKNENNIETITLDISY
jgi:hypothetical protein